MRRSSPDEKNEKNVGIWIRVSTEDQAKGESPEHHEKRARMYAESKGWNIQEVYHLEAVSGKSVMGHREAERMLKDIRDGRISGLIFSKLARLARNTRELLEFGDIFREQEADLISLQEAIDTSTPAGRLFFTIIAAMAQWEREEIAERVAASVPIRAKLGKPLGGAAPFGYRWDKETKKLLPDPNEAPVRKLLYELFLKHQRKKTVARLLNEAGHRTRKGKRFSDTTVDRLLQDPTAKGTRRANYSKSLGNKKAWVWKPESDWVFTSVEAIVSEELWDSCNEILRTQREGAKPRTRRTVQLFAGFVLCACGKKMYVPSNTPKYVCTKCRNKIPIEDLEAVFQEQLKSFILDPKEVQKYVEQFDEAIQKHREMLSSLTTERAKVQQEMDKVYRLYIENKVSPDGFDRLYRPLETRLKQLEDELPKIEAEIDFLRIQNLSQNQVVSDTQNLHAHWPSLEPQEKRLLIEAIMDQVVVGKDDVSFKLSYLPTTQELSAHMRDPFTSSLLRNGNRATQRHPCVAILPCCRLTLRGPRPRPAGYPNEVNTLGDHMRIRRLDCGWSQQQVAAEIGVDKATICLWETNRVEPLVRQRPKIIAFLGYVPYRTPRSFGEWLTLCRTSLGVSQEALAKALTMDESTIAKWERADTTPMRRSLHKLKEFFGSLPAGRGIVGYCSS